MVADIEQCRQSVSFCCVRTEARLAIGAYFSRWAPSVCTFATLVGGLGCAPDREIEALSVVATVPDAHEILPANAPIFIHFSDHIASGIAFGGRVTLTTGELDVVVQVGYDLVSKSVVVVPTTDLLVRRDYTLTLAAEGVLSVDGRRLTEDLSLDFHVGNPTSTPRSRPPVDFATQVAPLFAGQCGCHTAGQALPALTPSALVAQPSLRDPERTLVVPGDPRRSLLVQKVLVDYPGVIGGPMPPGEPLSEEAQRIIVGWVEGLGP